MACPVAYIGRYCLEGLQTEDTDCAFGIGNGRMTPGTEIAALVILVNHLLERRTGNDEFPDRGRLVKHIDMVALVRVNDFVGITAEEDDGTECTSPFPRTAIMIHQPMTSDLNVVGDLGDRVAIPTELDTLEPPEPMNILLQEVPDTTTITGVEILLCVWVATRPCPHLDNVAGKNLGDLTPVKIQVFVVYEARRTCACMTRVSVNICFVAFAAGWHVYGCGEQYPNQDPDSGNFSIPKIWLLTVDKYSSSSRPMTDDESTRGLFVIVETDDR